MKWKWCSRVGVVLCGAALCAPAYGEVVVEEHAGYQEGQFGDYRVYWDGDVPSILIREPSDPNLPYDFECYDDSTPWPYSPATIGAITARRNIGDVEIKVRGHEADDRVFGAFHVQLLQLNQAGVNSSVKEFNIEYGLGADGATEVDEISGLFSVDQLLNDIYIGTTTEDANLDLGIAFANVNITGPGPHRGSLVISSLPADPPEVHGIDITGCLDGTLQVGHLG